MKNLKKLKIAVLLGGMSSEREISIKTGTAIIKELKKHGHRVVAIDAVRGCLGKIIKAKPDVAINALHGTYGEDGTMQGALEFIGVPYTGSGVNACALAMNKVKAKEIFAFNGVTTADWQVVEEEKEVKSIALKYPLVFKPVSEGSAVGVTIAKSKKDGIKAFRTARKYGPVLVEKFIKGTEISVPVLGSRVLPIIEIVPKNEFYDFDAKYTPGMSDHIIPARISSDAYVKAAGLALLAHNLLGCRDLSRIDMIVSGKEVYVLEVNPLPGMTDVSLFPEAAKKAGISFYELIMILVKDALKRK